MLIRRKSDTVVAVAAAAATVLATFAAFFPLFDNQFVNWDDQYTLTGNDRLAGAGVLPWAFTTTLMGHYQPLTWLAWSAIGSVFGVNPLAFHAASLFGHLLNAVLVYALARRLFAASGLEAEHLRAGAFAAALLFAIHPMRVEPVAWASAFPYVLSLAWLLASALAYVRYCESDRSAARAWYGLAIGAYAISLLARVTGIGYPVVLVVLDVYPLDRLGRGRSTGSKDRNGARRAGWLVEKVPFTLAALLAAVVEARSREVAPLGEIGIGARITMAATAPLAYLGRMFLPLDRSPVDPLPIAPVVEWGPLLVALAALGAITFIVWTLRRRWQSPLTGWIAYLVLLAPAIGLTPSGQTATADRYTYVPAVALSMLAGGAIVQVESIVRLRRLSIVATLVVGALFGMATWRQTRWWHDSLALWTRAAALDPRNDIATFNLAVSLDQAGRIDEAITRYQQTLALLPEHEPARRALINLKAERGIALTKTGRFAEATADLRAAVEARPDDLALANAFSYSLVQVGRAGDAVAVLKQSLARHPENDELAHNLARLLATSQDFAVRDGTLALRLALAVRERTGGRDPRVLDTLAAAYAAAGQPETASRTAAEAATLARQLGDPALAAEIGSHSWSVAR